MLDSLQKDLLVGEEGFDLTGAFLENLGHNLRPQLVRRVGEDISDLQDYTVKELRVLKLRVLCRAIRVPESKVVRAGRSIRSAARETAAINRVIGAAALSSVHALEQDGDLVDCVLLQVLVVRVQLV